MLEPVVGAGAFGRALGSFSRWLDQFAVDVELCAGTARPGDFEQAQARAGLHDAVELAEGDREIAAELEATGARVERGRLLPAPQHCLDPGRQFPLVMMMGSVGWIAAANSLNSGCSAGSASPPST